MHLSSSAPILKSKMKLKCHVPKSQFLDNGTFGFYFLQLLLNKYLLAFKTVWANWSDSFVSLLGILSKYWAYDELLFVNWIGECEMLSSILWNVIHFIDNYLFNHSTTNCNLGAYIFKRSMENMAKSIASFRSLSVNVTLFSSLWLFSSSPDFGNFRKCFQLLNIIYLFIYYYY